MHISTFIFDSHINVEICNSVSVNNSRDIVIEKNNKTIKKLKKAKHPFYDALQYPLINWQGQEGYNIKCQNNNGKKYRVCISMLTNSWYEKIILIIY